MRQKEIQRVLFYFGRSYHISILLPVYHYWKQNSPRIEFAYVTTMSRSETPDRKAEGLDRKSRRILKLSGLKPVRDPFSYNPCVTFNADNNYRCVEGLGFIVNLSHGTISKGLYFLKQGFSIRENTADLLCVPGTIHRDYLKNCVHKPVKVTGMPKLDGYRTDQVKIKKQMNPFTLLIAPTFNEELSLWPHLLASDPVALFPSSWHVVIKLHDFMTDTLRDKFKEWSASSAGLSISEKDNITEHFAESSMLLTDVSSVAYEYTVTGKPLILFDSPRRRLYEFFDASHLEYRYRYANARITSLSVLARIVEKLHARGQTHDRLQSRSLRQFLYTPAQGASCRVVKAVQTYYRPLHPGVTVCIYAGDKGVHEKLWRQIGNRFKVILFTEKPVHPPRFICLAREVYLNKGNHLAERTLASLQGDVVFWVHGQYVYSDLFFDMGVQHFGQNKTLHRISPLIAKGSVKDPNTAAFLSTLNYLVCGRRQMIKDEGKDHEILIWRQTRHVHVCLKESGFLEWRHSGDSSNEIALDILALKPSGEREALIPKKLNSIAAQWLDMDVQSPGPHRVKTLFLNQWLNCRAPHHRLARMKLCLDFASALIDRSCFPEAKVYLEKVKRSLKKVDAKNYLIRYHYHHARLLKLTGQTQQAILEYRRVLKMEPEHAGALQQLKQ